MSCRCGKPPEKKCAECGRWIDPELGRCRAHPALDVDVVRCARCGRHLCAFHATVTPVSKAGGGIGLGEKCFPSCDSTFGAPVEKRMPVYGPWLHRCLARGGRKVASAFSNVCDRCDAAPVLMSPGFPS